VQINVRLAGPRDEEPLYDLLMALADDNNAFGYPLDEEKIRDDIHLGTEHKGGYYGVVDGKPGELAGAILIIWNRLRFTKRFHLEQIYLFVRPEYRRYRIADKLMEWIKSLRLIIEKDSDHPVHCFNTLMTDPYKKTKAGNRIIDLKREWWRKHCGDPVGYVFLMRTEDSP